jgi:hypothetical protein
LIGEEEPNHEGTVVPGGLEKHPERDFTSDEKPRLDKVVHGLLMHAFIQGTFMNTYCAWHCSKQR